MPVNRRNILYFLACTTGWPALSQAPQTAPPPAPSSPPLPTERVVGIGGLFFRSKDPKALAEWYRSNLGILPSPTSLGEASWHTEAGTTVFAPFSQTTKYLGEPTQMWMVNFRVRDLEKMAAQLRSANITVTVDPEHYPYGRFASVHDPEGNPIQLWEPA